MLFQASINVKIPKEHYRYIIGTKNKTRAELELQTATKIEIPTTRGHQRICEDNGHEGRRGEGSALDPSDIGWTGWRENIFGDVDMVY